MAGVKTNFGDLTPLLSPKSIAIVGASENPAKVGGRVIINLQKSRYKGKLNLVNPNYSEISGIPCYKKLTDIPDEIDVVIITVPVPLVLPTLDECEQKKVKFVMIFSGGFAEMGEEGRELQNKIKQFANRTGIRIYGPNVPGLFNMKERIGMSLSPRFEPDLFVTGKAALITQGGGMGRAILDSNDSGLGFNYWISTGNEADLEMSDFIFHFAEDPEIEIILLLIEGIKDGEKFKRACKRAKEKGKPIIALKIGQSEAGKAAVMSHTGALAGEENVAEAVFKQFDVIQVDDIDELVNTAWVFSTFGIRKLDTFGIMSFSGGANGILADKCGLYGLELGKFSDDTVSALEEIMPSIVECKNPFDLTTYPLQKPEVFNKALDIVIDDENIDAWFILIPYMLGMHTERMAALTIDKAKRSPKPIIPLWTSRALFRERSYEVFAESKMPFFRTFTEAAKIMSTYVNFCKKQFEAKQGGEVEHVGDEAALQQTLPDRKALTEYESKKLFKDFQIPVTEEIQTSTPEEAVEAARKIGYPVAMKIESPDILHKTEANVVRLNVRNDDEVREAFAELKKNAASYNPNAEIRSVLVQEMTEKGLELLVGLKKDPVFGLIAMVGLGGIFVEIFEDVSMRALPLTDQDIEEMIDEIKAKPLLEGYRGDKRRDIEALKELLRNVSRLGTAYKDVIEEIDINPIMLYEEGKGLKAVDGLIIQKVSKAKAEALK